MNMEDTTNSDPVEPLRQAEQRKLFNEMGTGPWTFVYRSGSGPAGEPALFSALASPEYRDRAVSGPSWDLSIGDGQPGFMQSYAKGEPTTSYLRFGGMSDEVEPLVLVQDHHGIRESAPQLVEEFRLLFNLWRDPKTGDLVYIDDDGSETVVAEVSDDEVRVRTPFLRRYQAARQLDLLLFIDSRARVDDLDEAIDLDKLSESQRSPTMATDLHAGRLRPGGPFSRYFGTKVLPPPAIETCGIWPFDNQSETYHEFIIGEDDAGQEVKHTCDPDQLADYFGGNSDAPHYLTPVYFRREVLQRYYDHPEKYDVRDGYLSCGSLWGVQIDNDSPDFVGVFLGDLGRDLPESERPYWQTFNVAPSSQLSESTVRRSFFAQFADSQSPDLRFKHAYRRFQEQWRKPFGWDLFKPPHDDDRHLLKSLRIPLNDSQPEFEAQLSILAKVIVDSLNESELGKLLASKVKDEKGISKFERWLQQEAYPHVARDIALLRKIQALRSRVAAHRKGSDYAKFIAKELGDADPVQAVSDLLVGLTDMLSDLESHFAPEDKGE